MMTRPTNFARLTHETAHNLVTPLCTHYRSLQSPILNILQTWNAPILWPLLRRPYHQLHSRLHYLQRLSSQTRTGDSHAHPTPSHLPRPTSNRVMSSQYPSEYLMIGPARPKPGSTYHTTTNEGRPRITRRLRRYCYLEQTEVWLDRLRCTHRSPTES